MISINRNDPPHYNNEPDDTLKALVAKISHDLEVSDMSYADDGQSIIIKGANLQDLLDTVYNKMYIENCETINVIVGKNENNSLTFIIDVIS